ncbi:PEP-CTERM sorting domain-containing protein [Coraliomargarita sp. W4R72]
MGGGTAFNPIATITDSSSAYLGGYAGFTHANDTGTYTFDNFSAIPEPSTYALIGGTLALAFVMTRRRL